MTVRARRRAVTIPMGQNNRHGCSHHRSCAMCDYSLQHLASRPAKVGDRLVSTKFANSIPRGFSAIGEPNVAVCVLPGTELVFDRDVECDHALGFFPNKKMRARRGGFRQ